MKVTKSMLDSELQSFFSPLKVMGLMFRRPWSIKLLHKLSTRSNGKDIDGLLCEEQSITGSSGETIRVRVFKPLNSTKDLPAMIYYHGGGYVVGNPETGLTAIKRFIDTRPCVVIAPDYRKAPDDPFPAGFDDCYDTLLWAKANASSLGIRDSKFMLAGHSAGGGLTAAVTLKARDTQDVDIAFQMPIYPMIDDRQTSESAKDSDAPLWNTKTNALAWSLYLKGLTDSNSSIPAYAAPSRNDNYKGFPPTITFVGDLEPFKDETISYVESLQKEGIKVRFKLYKGCFHAFDMIGESKANISKEALNFTFDSYAEYYDAYVK